MLERFHDALLTNDDMNFFNEDSTEVTFFANQMGILAVDLDKIILDDDNLDEDGPDLAWCSNFQKRKALNKDISEELVPVLWHSER